MLTESRKEYVRRYYLENKERILLYKREWAERNRERIRKGQHEKYLRNRDSIRRATKLTAQQHPERTRAYKRKWDAMNPGKANAKTARRYASKTKATPAWANQFFIDEIYDLASIRSRITGIRCHVDHIVPLRSKHVCGLHVEHNLKIIPMRVNQAKGNRYWPDMPGANT